MSNLKNTLPGIPRKWNGLDIDRSAVYPADLLSRRFTGVECYEAKFG